jgi:hypothetical protein
VPLKGEPLVKREITGIFTRGIIPYDPNSTDYDARWILSIFTESLQYTTDQNSSNLKTFHRQEKIGIVFFDNTTLQIHMGMFNEDILHT